MNCRSARRYLVDLFDCGAPEVANSELARHVVVCPQCGREYEEMKRAFAHVKPPQTVRASPDFRERVMNKIVADLTPSQNADAPKRAGNRVFDRNRLAAVIPKLAIVGAATIGLIVGLPYIGGLVGKRTQAPAPVMSLLAQSVKAMSNFSSVHISARMRTLPRDNFAMIGLDYDFVPIEMWKEFGEPPRWRIEKPGRVVVMDGTSLLLFIRPNYAHRTAVNAGIATWLRPLLDADQVLEKELRMAKRQESQTTLAEDYRNGVRQLVLTVDKEAEGDFSNDWCLNRSIRESAHSRIYRFDLDTKRLEGLQIFVHASRGDVLVFDVTSIGYNEPIDPALFSLSLPPDVVWGLAPHQLPKTARPLPTTPKAAAVSFFEAMSREDWGQVLALWPRSSLEPRLKKHFGGLQVLRIGEPFKSGLYPGWFVPYEIKLKSGRVLKHNLAVRNDNPSKRFLFDGGL